MSKLYKRVRRRVMGGTVELRIYEDGTCRIRSDHPTNDPEIEMAMVGRVFRITREVFAKAGLGEPVFGKVAWRDDP